MHVHPVITLETMDPTQAPAKPSPSSPPVETGKGTVMGLRLPGERLTAAGWATLLVVFVLPVLGVGLLLDALVQLIWGWCLGVWCWF